MRSVDLKVLRNTLSEYIRLAERGETVLVTDRDRVVAQIVPPGRSRSPVLPDTMLAEAIRRGWITPPAPAANGTPPRKPVMPFRALMGQLDADRGDR